MLNRHSARKIVTVEGLAASMASVIAMAGDEVVMPSNAMMMIHNPLGSITGGSDEIESFASALKIMRDNIAQAYKDRTGLGLDEIQKMMTRETWLSAEEAVAKGFADRIEAPRKIAASNLGLSRFTNVPDRLLDSLHSEGSHSTLAGITDRAYQKWNSAKPRSEEARDSAPDERASDSTLQSFQEDIYAKWNSRKRDAL
jgi:ClpP class serine protease